MVKPLPTLKDEQKAAADPRALVWLSASAGTGKTQVLVARVLRLLLRPHVDPASILCLTFTKAGAAEMANRLSERLAHWVRLGEADLRKELWALGEDTNDPALMTRARGLFARVLDARGGGLRIQTIHAFAQSLLGSFPLEAGLAPGFRAVDPREESALSRQVLADMVVDAEREGRSALIANLQALSRRLGEEGAERFLRDCARAPDAMASLPSGIAPFVRRALDLPTDDIEAHLAERCADDSVDLVTLSRIAAHSRDWGTKTGLDRADAIARWLALPPAKRAEGLRELSQVWSTNEGALRSFVKGQAPPVDGYAELATRMHEWCVELTSLRERARLAELFAAALDAGRSYASAYADAKQAAGLVDFDDLIRSTVGLLGNEGIGDWIRFKLDQATDHILVDEAQDTNLAQWQIVAGLAAEFFAGDGAKGSRLRTIFSVGDYKQAIFGFQGTDPMFFTAAKVKFAEQAQGVGRAIDDLSLSRSFRSTPPVLEVVDEVIRQLPVDALGADVRIEPHVSDVPGAGPGTVTLWRPIVAGGDFVSDDEEDWIDDSTREVARRIARQIRRWLDEPLWLEQANRPLRPEDIMILVRKRGDLASLIVARLYTEGVPVAGVDRLRLNAPLAVQDLLAAARFALQPGDDLNLAALLVSPLIGWSQDDLLARAIPRPGPLWPHLRSRSDIGSTLDALGDLLATADYTTPYRFFEQILSGPLQGRRRLLGRLGEEARDPIEELLSAALAFEGQANPSLQRFLDWFDRGEVEIVRDPSQPLDAVRVMTAHGAKGLQAPLVILADAASDPNKNRRTRVDWKPKGVELPLPMFRPRKAELAGSLAEDLARAERLDREEHWRLLYVAMTRAEERLVIAGALGPQAGGVVPSDSWYAAIDRGMDALGCAWQPTALWGEAREWRGHRPAPPVRGRVEAVPRPVPAPVELPAWLHAPAPVEARPPRPLAPSSIGTDDASDPPPGPALRAAAERGRLLHALFERLPPIAPDDRRAAADRWLATTGGVADATVRATLAEQACQVISDPRFADVFAPDALAEAPIAAVVDGQVIAGTVDRLLVTDERVLIVDFKTNRRAPTSLDEAPPSHLKQIAAYAAALERIFPGRTIVAGLLYTSAPVLLELDTARLAALKQDLTR